MNKSKIAVYALVIAVFLISIIPQTITVAESRVRVIIGVKGPDDLNTIKRLCLGCNVHLEILELNVIVIEAPRSIINYLSKLPFVRYIEEDKPVRAFEEVQWNIEMINATDVWSTYSLQYGDAAYGYNPTIRVAVLDTGVDYQHVDLQGAVTYCIVSLRNTKTYYEGTNLKNCADPNGHGTHVAGIIAARLNGQGVAGVAVCP